MSVEIIKKEIARFLNCETPEVMAIKGKWGTGKTYTWNEFLKESQQNKQITLKTYSYVSLFGINSLEEFKYAVFKNSIDKELIDKGVSVDSLINNIDGLSKHLVKKSLSFLENISRLQTRINMTTAIESIAFASIKEKIICIDDLERKGKNLDIKDILGLVSVLKEQKRCKIVLLLNDGEEGLGDYTKYREKVIDIELEFAPTVEENVEIAFKDKDSYAIQILKESAIKLNIKNIRILKQIERLVNLVIDCLGTDYEPEITYQVASSLTLFAWCYYCYQADGAPPLEYLIKTTSYDFESDFNELSKEKEETEDQKNWTIIIRNYGYNATENFDLVLSKVIKTGYVTEDEIKKSADAKNKEVLAYKAGNSYRNAWDLFHNSFDDNKNEVVALFCEKVKSNIKHITPYNLDEVVSIFRELDEKNKADELIDFFISARRNEMEIFSPKNLSGWENRIKDTSITEKFAAIYQEKFTEETAEQVLERIAGKNGCNPKDTEILSNTTIEQYVDLFKSIHDKDKLNYYVHKCLEFGEFQNSDVTYKEISNRAKEALKIIAKESKINELRIKYKFEIELD
ncbi:MAG: hypothetical protein QX203_06410 [Methylococcaceae bacterium]